MSRSKLIKMNRLQVSFKIHLIFKEVDKYIFLEIQKMKKGGDGDFL